MGYLAKKTIKGKSYYYYMETKRIDGKIKCVKQIYLGRAEKILKQCQQSSSDTVEVYHQAFGDVAALYALLKRLELIPLVNHHVKEDAAKVGKYIALAAINRCIAPKSKLKIGGWYQKTTLPSLIGLPKNKVTSQRFWDAMDALSQQKLEQIEQSLWKRLVSLYPLSLEALLYDTTNFYTYIQDKSKGRLPQRGKNKAGKHQLNQVGLALVVTKVYGLPLLHQVYPGNQHDAKVFPQVITDLVARYARLAQTTSEITLVFDKGNNSIENLTDIDSLSEVHFIGSLVPSHFPELLKVRLSRYEKIELENGKIVLAFSTTRKVFEKERKVVVTYNEELAEKQKHTLERHMSAAASELLSIQWGRVKRRKERVEAMLSHYRVKDLITVEFDQKQAFLSYNHQEIHRRTQSYGKTILFTDQLNWTAQQIIQAYRDKHTIEACFQHMNDPGVVSFHPMYHWTDSKICVHAFICVLGLLLLRCLQLQLKQVNFSMSLPVLLEELADIRAIIMVTSSGTAQQRISHLSAVQKRLFTLFGLGEIAQELGIQFFKPQAK